MGLGDGNEEKKQVKRLPTIDKKARRVRMPVWLKENRVSAIDLSRLYITILEEMQ
jgi:hypothetical protein